MIESTININGEGFTRKLYHVTDWFANSEDQHWESALEEADPHFCDVFSSLCDDGLHRLALDVDNPWPNIETVIERLTISFPLFTIGIRYWESSTPGNYHVIAYGEPMTWEFYDPMLRTICQQMQIIQLGYYNASVANQQTILRLPHIKKNSQPEPVVVES